MKFMTTYALKPGVRDAALDRFKKTGGTPPAGVKFLGRWHKAAGNAGFILVETGDAKLLGQWALDWNDLIVLEYFPVVDDAEFIEVLGRR